MLTSKTKPEFQQQQQQFLVNRYCELQNKNLHAESGAQWHKTQNVIISLSRLWLFYRTPPLERPKRTLWFRDTSWSIGQKATRKD